MSDIVKIRNKETGEVFNFNRTTGEMTPVQSIPRNTVEIGGIEDSLTGVGRQLGLGTRAAIEGVAGLPLMLGDAANTLINRVTGSSLGMPSRTFSESLPLPVPQTAGERIASAGVTGGMGALTGSGVARAIPALSALAVAPGAQTVSGVTAGLSGQGAQEAGAGVLGQTGAALLGGIAPGAALGLARTSGSALSDLARPLTASGRERIVGRHLRSHATDPDRAMLNMSNTSDFIGQPTTGQASRDIGLLSLEKTARGLDDVRFGQRVEGQNIARNNMLDDIAGFADDVDTAKALRSEITTPMRENVLANAGAVRGNRVAGVIDDILSGPEGSRDLVQKALKPIAKKVEGETSAERLYGIRKDVNDKIRGASDDPSVRFADMQLLKVKNAIDDEIERASGGGWRDYLRTYANESRKIDQLERLQDIRARTANAVQTSQGTDVIANTKWHTNVKNKRGELKRLLSPGQMEKVDRITKDLQRTAPPPEIRQAGSDSFRNFSAANVLGNLTSNQKWIDSPAVQSALRPFSYIYKLPDEAISDLIVDAMADPKLAERLMSSATDENIRTIARQMSRSLRSATSGTGFGILSEGVERK